ncbi:hypothetical protein SAMN04487970_11033 [Paenibacillus tianmuensis]|uniref:Phage ABA sandwich domain-containing protein n=1 Tax=Paenibacillus tianmuensis TaxID=624147 RepID=A0A1G4U2P7_9BACL|nr:hypothetical protein [Paenibacillus tianmuensis]SCW87827.1 hypothetical protein SAMN04487970_11033 [Paenibacillus tianmuensis]
MTRDQILTLKPDRKLDGAVAHNVMGFKLNVREVYICPECGWETGDLETSSRCQACWANGDRVTMSDEKESVYDFKPSTDMNDAIQVLQKPEIMDRFQIGLYPTSFGKWIARPFMPGGKDCAVQADSPSEAICKSVLLAVLGV